MARRAQETTEAELAVLRVLWQEPGSTIRRIAESLYRERTAAVCATVLKLLERLEAKGFVERDRRGHAHAFSARVAREDLVGSGLRTLADRFCDGAMNPLLTCLVKAGKLTREERAALRDLLADPRRPSRKPTRRPRKDETR